MAGRDIQKDQLVSPLFAISPAQFYWIACLTKVHEVSPFHRLSVFDVKTWNNSFC